jgi:outer membrane protein TolC
VGTVDPGLTLQSALQAALTLHPEQTSLSARAHEAEALEARAGSWIASAPTALVRYQTDRLGGPEILGDNVGLQEVEPLLTVPLWRPGQRRTAGELGAAADAASDAAGPTLALRVAGRLRGLLWRMDELERATGLTQAAADAAGRRLAAVRRSVELGELARTDALLAEREAIDRQGAVLDLEAALVDAWFEWRQLTGLGRRPPGVAETPEALDDVPLASHPALQLAEAEYRRQRAAAENVSAQTRGQPTLTLGPRSERARENTDPANSFGVILSIPIGGGAHVRARTASAERTAADAAAAVGRLRRDLVAARHEAEHMLEVVSRQVDLASRQAEAASAFAELDRIAFDGGELSLMELLRAESTELDTRLMLIRHESAYRLALARINQAAGVLP